MSAAAPLQTSQAKTQKAVNGALFLQRKCACGSGAFALTGECEECVQKNRLGLQTKFQVNELGDSYEQEADRIADQVTAAPAHPAVSGAPRHIQRFFGQPVGQTETVPASVNHVLASSGRPLEPALQQDMEQRFGHDFSRVRVHTDAKAAESARAVEARAYTVGRDVVFSDGHYAPHSREGSQLLAHELAHVIQQERGGSSPPALRGGVLEQHADAAASTFVTDGGPIHVGGASAPGLARQPLPCKEERKPQLLKESLQAKSLPDFALAEEIQLISEWLQCNTSDRSQSFLLSSELDRLEGERWRRTQKAEKKAEASGTDRQGCSGSRGGPDSRLVAGLSVPAEPWPRRADAVGLGI